MVRTLPTGATGAGPNEVPQSGADSGNGYKDEEYIVVGQTEAKKPKDRRRAS